MCMACRQSLYIKFSRRHHASDHAGRACQSARESTHSQPYTGDLRTKSDVASQQQHLRTRAHRMPCGRPPLVRRGGHEIVLRRQMLPACSEKRESSAIHDKLQLCATGVIEGGQKVPGKGGRARSRYKEVGYTANCGTVQLFGMLPTAARSAAEAVGRAFGRG